MDIINDSGKIRSILIQFSSIDLLKIQGGQIEYLNDMLSPMLQHILINYVPNGYNYSPNLDYEKSVWLCQQLKQLGLKNCKIILIDR